MNFPVIYLIVPAVISASSLLIRKRTLLYRGILLALTFLLSSSAFILTLQNGGRYAQNLTGEKIYILGRSLTIQSTELPFIGFIYFVAFIWILSTISREINDYFPAICVFYCSLNIASYSIDPFLYSVLIIFLANVMYLPVLSSSTNRQISGRMRFLVFQLLSVFLILLAGWILAGGEIAPVNEDQLFFSSILLGFGIALWLGAFPFHTWIPLLADEVSFLPFGFMMTMIPVSGVMMLLKFLNDFAWLREYSAFFLAIQYLGAFMIVLGSIGAFFQKSLNRMFAFIFIMGIGLLLCATGFIPKVSTELVSMWILVYVITCWSISVGYHQLSGGSSMQSIGGLNGMFYENPIYAALLLSGIFSLVGFPLFSGFAPMLNLVSTALPSTKFIITAILLGQLFLMLSAVRLLLRLILHSDKKLSIPNKVSSDRIYVAFIMLLNLILGIFPGFIYGRFADMIAKIFPLL